MLNILLILKTNTNIDVSMSLYAKTNRNAALCGWFVIGVLPRLGVVSEKVELIATVTRVVGMSRIFMEPRGNLCRNRMDYRID